MKKEIVIGVFAILLLLLVFLSGGYIKFGGKRESIEYSVTTEYLMIALNKKVYSQAETMIITIKNVGEKTIFFGGTGYDLQFEKWDGESWHFYIGIIQAEVITPLQPDEEATVLYKLGEALDYPFPVGRYRVGTNGWYEINNEIHRLPMIYIEFDVV
ncbi:MAG: hypothetical protein AOA65_1024 [Candidatus Bathyarchaeota archaeon BA1]|nr:MAG: hypothetical protein AOA65_1024 [Candidatus Bathyarchaeota archaeon BA1]